MQTRMITLSIEDTLEAPSLENNNRLRHLSMNGWDWLVQSFNEKGQFCIETVHKDEQGKDTELAAITMIGRTSVVKDLRPYRDPQ